jgi:hypothetical protein
MIARKRNLLTLATPLAEIPGPWLRYIEPKIERDADDHWLWQGAHDQDGEPVLNFFNAVTGHRNTRRVKRMVAEMFWTLLKRHDVIHQCGILSCLNPAHLVPSVTHWTQR